MYDRQGAHACCLHVQAIPWLEGKSLLALTSCILLRTTSRKMSVGSVATSNAFNLKNSRYLKVNPHDDRQVQA